MAFVLYGGKKMKIVEKSIDEIYPYENNPRFNERAVEPLAKSIVRFGFKQPIVIDKNNVIVCGHTRLKAAQKIGLKTVPCVIADDLTEKQIKAYRLADNKIAELSTWNKEFLDIELEDIANDEDMLDFGFADVNIDMPIELDDEITSKEQKQKVYTCPKCGFVFEVSE